ncbi:MAG: transglycosylase SLT domain-containing protein [Candidatus Diapherotrites archaeon]
MATSIFRLAVYAIAALAFLWIMLAYFGPLPAESVAEQMGNALASSRTSLGKTLTKEILYPENFSVDAGQQLDEPDMGVVFKCNSASLCLGGAADIDEENRRLYVNESRDIMTSFRCAEEMGMHACVVYLGLEPAQVEMLDFESSEKYDLAAGDKPKISFTVANTGELAAVEITGTAMVYRKTLLGGKEVEQLFLGPVVKTVRVIEPGKTAHIDFDFSSGITKNGKYAADVRVEGPDAGFGTKRFEFEVAGAPEVPSACVAKEEGETTLESGICILHYLCEGCENASECKWAWEERLPGAEFEIGARNYTIAEDWANKWGCGGEEPEPPIEPPVEPPSNGDGNPPIEPPVEPPMDVPADVMGKLEFYANKYDVPPELVKGLVDVESNFLHYKNGAIHTSPAGAIGIMQIMPPSKRKSAAGQDCINNHIIESEQDLHDIEHNIDCGVWYLRQIYNRAVSKGEVCCKKVVTVIVKGKEEKECHNVSVKPCYVGWRAALRLYNGLCCGIYKGSESYVELVESNCKKYGPCDLG